MQDADTSTRWEPDRRAESARDGSAAGSTADSIDGIPEGSGAGSRDGGSDHCPRCGGAFHCGVADAAPCACSQLTLDAATLADLRLRYRSCLCLRCLTELARAAPRMPPALP